MAKNPSLTILAPYFPPRPRVGSIRPYRFAKYLSKMGWDVSVICIGDSKNELSDQQKEDLSEVYIHNLLPPIDRTQKKKSTSGDSQKNSGSELLNWFDRHFPIDTWYPFLLGKKGEIENVLIEQKTDILLSTSDPWSSAVISERVTSALDIPMVADLRDPWTLCDTRFRRKGVLARYFEEKAEYKVMKSASFVTFTSTTTEDKYVSHYKELNGKTATIRNSFDLAKHNASEIESNDEGKFIILFLGSFRTLSTAESIIHLLKEMKRQSPKLYERIEIHSFGSLEKKDEELASSVGVLDKFVRRKKVSHHAVQNEIVKSNLLLLSTKPERDDIIPAKLFDYLPSGKPILSMVDNPEVKEIIEVTKTGVHVGTKGFSSAIEFIAQLDKGTLDLKPNTAEIEQYSANHRAQELDDVLRKVLQNVG